MHAVPHAFASSSRAQAEPHLCVPVLQLKPHMALMHVASLASGGTSQGAHEVPHELTSESERHKPLHACVPGPHPPTQGDAASMQAPLQSFLPEGHAPPQAWPSHVGVPPSGAWHGVHEPAHDRQSLSATQFPLQSC